MFDWSSVLSSLGLHAVLIIMLVWSAAFGVKPPPVKYEVIRARVVLPPVPEPKVEPVVKESEKKSMPKPPAAKPKATAKAPAQPKPPVVAPAQKKEKLPATAVSKTPQAASEPSKAPESKLPEIDLPLIPEWTSVLAEEQETLDDLSRDIAKETAEQERGVEIRAHYVELIRNRIGRYWARPLSARNGMEVELSLRLLPDGSVHRVEVSKSSGDALFDRSCLQAVQRAGTLPVPEDSEIFNNLFKRFRLKFRPEDLQQ